MTCCPGYGCLLGSGVGLPLALCWWIEWPPSSIDLVRPSVRPSIQETGTGRTRRMSTRHEIKARISNARFRQVATTEWAALELAEFAN